VATLKIFVIEIYQQYVDRDRLFKKMIFAEKKFLLIKLDNDK